MNGIVRRLAHVAIAGAGMLALAFPMPIAASLSASAVDLTLGLVAYSHDPQVSSGTLVLSASDTGGGLLGQTNAGWNVTLQSSSFAYTGTGIGSPIPAANLALTTAHPPTRVSGQNISPSGGPRTTSAAGGLDVPRKTMQADGPTGVLIRTYYGIGTYQQLLDVSLAVPPQTSAGTYTATLTVTMSAGP